MNDDEGREETGRERGRRLRWPAALIQRDKVLALRYVQRIAADAQLLSHHRSQHSQHACSIAVLVTSVPVRYWFVCISVLIGAAVMDVCTQHTAALQCPAPLQARESEWWKSLSSEAQTPLSLGRLCTGTEIWLKFYVGGLES
jgi:hypothetical protein